MPFMNNAQIIKKIKINIMKKFPLFVISMLLFFNSCTNCDDGNSQEPIDRLEQGLVAYYPLNGDVKNYSTQDLGDLDGWLVGDPAIFENSISSPGNSYKLTNPENVSVLDVQYIGLSGQIDQHFEDAASYSAWINIEETNRTGTFLSNYDGSNGDLEPCFRAVGFTASVTPDNELLFYYSSNDANYRGRKTAIEAIENNKWHHVVLIWNGLINNSNSFEIYIDGVRRDSQDHSLGSDVCNTFKISDRDYIIGLKRSRPTPINNLNGAVDEVRFYDRVLSNSEIQELKEQGIPQS